MVIAQKENYRNKNNFANSTQQLNIDSLPPSKNFEYALIFPKYKTEVDGMFIVAKAKNNNDRNFVAVVYAYEMEEPRWRFKYQIYTQVCGAKRSGTSLPQIIITPSTIEYNSLQQLDLYSKLRCPKDYVPIPR